jgi:4-hydroxy-tetrahydrodipicolinate synthase
MVTPFDAQLAIDLDAYRATVEWYIACGVGGLYANCLSSEMYALDAAERLTLVSEAVAAAAGRVPVAATGNLGDTLDAHVELCRRVAAAGADVVMLVVPAWIDDDAALRRYLLTIAERVDAPLGLYECPVPRPYHLGVELVGELARSGRFVAYKETSCNLEQIGALLEVIRGTPLALLQANTPYLLEATRLGCPGSMGIASIWLPDLVGAIIARAQAGDADATRLHAALCALELAQRAVHPAGTKYLLGKRGLPVAPRVRQPARPLAPEEQAALDAAALHWFDNQGRLAGLGF